MKRAGVPRTLLKDYIICEKHLAKTYVCSSVPVVSTCNKVPGAKKQKIFKSWPKLSREERVGKKNYPWNLIEQPCLRLWAGSVIESPCTLVCLFEPSQNTHFRVSWRLLVKGRIANIGLWSRFFWMIFTDSALRSGSVIESPCLFVCLFEPSQNTHFRVSWRLLVKGCIANIGLWSHVFLDDFFVVFQLFSFFWK